MGFDNNCSCIWLIIILLLVFCCCGGNSVQSGHCHSHHCGDDCCTC